MTKSKSKISFFKANKKQLIYVVVILLLGLALVPNFNQFLDGLTAIGQANLKWIAVASFGLLGTYLATAGVYVSLANRLKYVKTAFVQLATSFANRVLPGGFGGLGLNIDYLIKSGYRGTESTAIGLVGAIVAFISHIILIALALILSHKSISSLWSNRELSAWVAVIVLIILLLVLVAIKIWRRKILRAVKSIVVKTASYRRQPKTLVMAILSATFVTLFFVLALWACAQAMGMSISFVQTFIVYTTGVLVGLVTPTPGGLGGMEAGLVAGMVAYGQTSSLAFSAVIIYRLVTYWLPIIPGYLCFWVLRRKKVI